MTDRHDLHRPTITSRRPTPMTFVFAPRSASPLWPPGRCALPGAAGGYRHRLPHRGRQPHPGATADSAAYRRLGRLVDTFGHRLSGSASLEATIDWILDLMKADGLRERARRAGHGAALGAGRGVGRAGEAARAPSSRCWASAAAWGRPRRDHRAGAGGDLASTSSSGGPRRPRGRSSCSTCRSPTTSPPGRSAPTARRPRPGSGAVACLIRSVASASIRSPHTGAMRYDSTAAQDPRRRAQRGGRR